jgi:hypothetical protein
MTRPTVLVLALAALALAVGAAEAQTSPSPYTGLTGRAIKALAPEQIEQYLEGHGMGFALAAELNGYPGPKHVLELAAELDLSAEQREAVQGAYDRMHEQAVAAGKRIVALEGELDRAFASGRVSSESLDADLTTLGGLLAEVRFAHLDAHLATKALLSPAQVARYVELRGYGGGGQPPAHDPSRHDPSRHGGR